MVSSSSSSFKVIKVTSTLLLLLLLLLLRLLGYQTNELLLLLLSLLVVVAWSGLKTKGTKNQKAAASYDIGVAAVSLRCCVIGIVGSCRVVVVSDLKGGKRGRNSNTGSVEACCVGRPCKRGCNLFVGLALQRHPREDYKVAK